MNLFILYCLFLFQSYSFKIYADAVSFESWVNQEIKTIKKNESNPQNLEIKLKPFLRVKDFLVKYPMTEIQNKMIVNTSDDFIYTEIIELFHGNYLKACDLYQQLTLGKHPKNLFIESGAGAFEKINHVKETSSGIEFVTDRIYKSQLAFNSRTKVRLIQFPMKDKKLVIVVNELIKDLGEELTKNKIKNMDKPYGHVAFDVNIDIYQSIDNEHFLYSSFSLYEGQGLKSTSQALNVAKKVGNIFFLGVLDKKLNTKIAYEAKAVWGKRKTLFQELLKK